MSLFTDLKEVLTPYAQRIKALDTESSNIKADLGDKVGVFSKTEGYYINLTTDPVSLTPQSTTTAGMAFAIIECVSGDKFVINAVGGNSGRAWGFIDSGNHVLSAADANATVEGLELTAPTNAVKLIINDKSGGVSYKVGNNLVSRVTALESVEPGLSENAKTALINLVSHIGTWTDGNGQRYVDTFVAALNGEQTIKVFIGKGTSGSAIIDNPKRALTEPIPFINTTPITVRRTVADDGYRYSVKFCINNETVSNAKAGTAWAPGDKERPEGMQLGWIYSSNEQTLKEVVTTTQLVFGEPTVFEDTTNNTIRLLFAAYDSITDDLPQNAPMGSVIVQGITYKLEVGNNEDFV